MCRGSLCVDFYSLLRKCPGQILAGRPLALEDRDGLAISHHECTLINIKLKMHIEILGHTPVARNFQNTNKWRKKTLNSVTLCTQKSNGWPLLRGWPAGACYGC